MNRFRVHVATRHLPLATDSGAGRPAAPNDDEDDEVDASAADAAALDGELEGDEAGKLAAAAEELVGLVAPQPGSIGVPGGGLLSALLRLASLGFA